MNEDFAALRKAFLNEYKTVFLAENNLSMEDRLRSLATLAGIAGSMRAIREYAVETIEKSEDVEKLEQIISKKVIPKLVV